MKVRSVREGGCSPDGKLGGVETITKVSADIGASGDVLGEIGGGLVDNLLPEGVGMGDVVGEEIEKHTAALLGYHAVLESVDSSGSGVGGGQAGRGDVRGVDDLAEAVVYLLGGSSLVCPNVDQLPCMSGNKLHMYIMLPGYPATRTWRHGDSCLLPESTRRCLVTKDD